MEIFDYFGKAMRSYVGRNFFRGLKNSALRHFPGTIKPRWIWYGVTDKCNSRCTHCSIWKQKPDARPLTPQELERALKDPVFSELQYIITSGGEPVLREDIVDILLLQHRLLPGAEVHLSTNALLPERVIEVVAAMHKNGAPVSVGVSLDGIGARHDEIRGQKGNFEKADRLLRELVMMRDKLHYKVSPGIGLTLSDLTMDNYFEVAAYAEKLGVACLPQWLNQSSFYENTGKTLVHKSAGKEKMLEIVRSMPPSILRDKWVDWLNEMPIRFPCFAMHTFFVLRCNGDVAPCLSHWDVTAGNVRDNTPTEVWKSLAADKARRVVAGCEGCLNSWGVEWSANSSVYPMLLFYLRHRDLLLKKIRGGDK